MSKSLMASMVDALLPRGSIWTARPGGFFDKFLLGLSDSFEIVRLKLSGLANIRNANLTTVLDELERDYGVAFNPNLTEVQRRAALDSRINAIDNTGSAQELELALQRAGFPLFVYQNSPAVDPRRFESDYLLYAGGENAYAGVSTAIAASFKSDIVVNGDVVITIPEYSMSAGNVDAVAGNEAAFAGITGEKEGFYEYFLPEDPALWPFIFFVGGSALFSETGELISIALVDIDDNRRLELREIILKYKPTFTWAVLVINFV